MTQRVYVVAPHLLWGQRWAEQQFRSGALDIRDVFYSVKAGALDDIRFFDLVVLVNPVMCTGEKWELVKDALELRRTGQALVRGASVEPLARFTGRMQKDPRHVPFESKAGM